MPLQLWHPAKASSIAVQLAMEHLIPNTDPAALVLGDKFGESLGGSQAPPSFWEVPGLPRKFPRLPRKFFGDFPGSSLTVELYSNPGVPRKFPRLPRKFPRLPRKFPGLPRRSALSLGSLTPSPDSQKLSLMFTFHLDACLGLRPCPPARKGFSGFRPEIGNRKKQTWFCVSPEIGKKNTHTLAGKVGKNLLKNRIWGVVFLFFG